MAAQRSCITQPRTGETHDGQARAPDRRAVRRRCRARRRHSVRPAHGRVAPGLSRRRRPGRHERRGRRLHRASRPYAGRSHTRRVRPGSQEGHACRRAASPGRPAEAQLPRQGFRPRRAGRQAPGGGNARAPARRRHHADLQVLHPQQRPAARSGKRPRWLEAHHRRRGQQAARNHARRIEEAHANAHLSHGAGVRRQRPLVLHPAGARQPVDQRRRRLRGVDRHPAGERAADGRREVRPPSTPPTTAPTSTSRATPSARRSRAACRWPRP